MAMDLAPVLSVKQAAAYLGLSPWAVYEYCRQGVIPHRRVGRRILIGRDALARWLAGDGEPGPGAGAAPLPVRGRR